MVGGFIVATHTDKRTELIYKENGLPMYGAVCTGKYSYVWNSGYAVDSGKKVSVKGDNDFRLAKWDDPITESNKETICSANVESANEYKKSSYGQHLLKVAEGRVWD